MTAPFEPVDFSPASRDFPWKQIDYERDCLVCPTCGQTYNHPWGVEANRGGDIVHCFGLGPPHQVQGLPAGRGALIRLFFYCEDGHLWARLFQFHKGCTYTTDIALPTPPDGEMPLELWRD